MNNAMMSTTALHTDLGTTFKDYAVDGFIFSVSISFLYIDCTDLFSSVSYA